MKILLDVKGYSDDGEALVSGQEACEIMHDLQCEVSELKDKVKNFESLCDMEMGEAIEELLRLSGRA